MVRGCWEFWEATVMATDDFFRVRLDSMIDIDGEVQADWATTHLSRSPGFESMSVQLLLVDLAQRRHRQLRDDFDHARNLVFGQYAAQKRLHSLGL